MAVANKFYYTSSDLVSAVKRKASIPDSQSMITDNEILEFANEEMEINLLQLITKRHEDYFLVREDVALLAGQVEYQIPYRAIGSKIRELAFSDDGINLLEMNRISIDELTGGYHSNSLQNADSYGGSKYYIQNENLVLHTQPSTVSAEGYLAIFYNLSPNALVDSSRVGVITSIDRASGLIGMSSLPSNFSLTNEYDFIKTRAPHKIHTFDITAIEISSANSTITIDPVDIPSQLAIGDRVASAGETDVINCPSELHNMLAEMVVARVLESIGDTDNLNSVNQKITKMEQHVGDLLDNRVDGSPIKVKPRNGFLRRGRRR